MEILYIIYLGIAIALLVALLYKPYLRYVWRDIIKPPSSQTVRGSRQLQNQLLTLLHGDTATAKRLLVRQQQRHPGKSDNWYLEKAIYDLERDRRS